MWSVLTTTQQLSTCRVIARKQDDGCHSDTRVHRMVQVAGQPVGAPRVRCSVDAAHAVDGNLLDEEFFDHAGGLVVGRTGVVTGVVGGDECVFLHMASVSIQALVGEHGRSP